MCMKPPSVDKKSTQNLMNIRWKFGNSLPFISFDLSSIGMYTLLSQSSKHKKNILAKQFNVIKWQYFMFCNRVI